MARTTPLANLDPATIDRGLEIAERLNPLTLIEQADDLMKQAEAAFPGQKARLANQATFALLKAIAESNEAILEQLRLLNGGK